MLITGTQAKAADNYAINVLGIPSLTLMHNASHCAADFIASCWRSGNSGSSSLPAAISVCGVGNNGADGLCISRFLTEYGFKAEAVICGRLEKATPEFEYQLAEAKKAGVRVKYYEEEEDCLSAVPGYSILIDALFGVGLHRDVAGVQARLIEEIVEYTDRFSAIYAIDVPSGINSDTGEVMGCAVRADMTLTFGHMKTGLLMQEGCDYTGHVEVFDIGIPEEAYEKAYRRLTTLCYIEQDDCYLMLYRNKKENDLNEGKWIGVGGKVEEGEDPDTCIYRETLEETGLELKELNIRGIVSFVSDKWEDEEMFLYTASAFDGSLKEDCDEGELKWIPKSELDSLSLWEGDRIFLKMLAEGKKNISLTLRYEGDRLAEVTG